MEDDGWARAMAPFYEGRDASHDLRHAAVVAATTARLCRTPPSAVAPADARVAAGAAWVHDALDAKYRPTRRARAAVRRALVGAGLLDAASAERAVRIGERISFSARVARGGAPPADLPPADVPLYLLVSDADMLEALGAAGVVRTSVYQSSRHGGAPGAIEAALDYVEGTLVRCRDLMTHPDAAAEATRRVATMRLFARALRDERAWGGAPRCPAG